MAKKRTDYPTFSNGTEAMSWMACNCDVCVKAEHPIIECKMVVGYANRGRCRVNEEIIESMLSDGVSRRVHKIINMPVCPFRKKEWDKRKKKDVEPKLFDE